VCGGGFLLNLVSISTIKATPIFALLALIGLALIGWALLCAVLALAFGLAL
jgi:hypothetical protein